MNDINDIYREFGDDFCLCPFLGGFYQSHHVLGPEQRSAPSTLVPCSVTWWHREAGTFNTVNDSIIDSANQPAWIEMRRSFAQGRYRDIPQCKICHDTERAGGNPARRGANLHYVHHCTSDLVDKVKQIIANEYKVDELLSLDWYPSNYCNYSCIMCSGGASTGRMSFELKVQRQQQHVVINATSHDFYDVIRRVEIINFTGGETTMQTQVHDMIDYLVDNDLAANKTIFLLTNASTYPENLIEKFRNFRRVVYMCSMDGTGPVIEYQRRGAIWSDVEQNCLKLLKHDFISTVINYVVTAANVHGIVDFVDWLHRHDIVNGVSLSPVFRVEHIGVSAMPHTLRSQVINEIELALARYDYLDTAVSKNCVRVLETVRQIITSTPFDPNHLVQFRAHISDEDSVSRVKFLDVCPQWAPYFR